MSEENMKIVRLTKQDNEALRWALTATDDKGESVISGVLVTGEKIVSTNGYVFFAAELPRDSILLENDGEILKGKVASGATVAEMETVDGEFPDYQRLISDKVEGGAVAEVTVSSRRLIAALKGMTKGENDGTVTIRFYGEMKPVEVIGKQKDGSGVYSLIMPMRLSQREEDKKYWPRWRPVGGEGQS